MRNYRLTPDKLCSKTFRVNHSSRSDYCAHSTREWIAAMKAVHKQHGNVYAGLLQKHNRNLYLEGIWLNGGDWDPALRVLGFTPERMRLRTYWDAERITTKIRFLRARRVPLYPAYASNITLPCSPQLYAHSILGQTHSLPPVSKFLTARMPVVTEFYGALRDALKQHSRNDLPEKLKTHAVYYFGSLRKAKAALKTDRRILAG